MSNSNPQAVEAIMPVRGQMVIVSTQIATTTQQIANLRAELLKRFSDIESKIDTLQLAQSHQWNDVIGLRDELEEIKAAIG